MESTSFKLPIPVNKFAGGTPITNTEGITNALAFKVWLLGIQTYLAASGNILCSSEFDASTPELIAKQLSLTSTRKKELDGVPEEDYTWNAYKHLYVVQQDRSYKHKGDEPILPKLYVFETTDVDGYTIRDEQLTLFHKKSIFLNQISSNI